MRHFAALFTSWTWTGACSALLLQLVHCWWVGSMWNLPNCHFRLQCRAGQRGKVRAGLRREPAWAGLDPFVPTFGYIFRCAFGLASAALTVTPRVASQLRPSSGSASWAGCMSAIESTEFGRRRASPDGSPSEPVPQEHAVKIQVGRAVSTPESSS